MLRKDGWRGLVVRLRLWLRGERGYWMTRLTEPVRTSFEQWMKENVPPGSPYLFFATDDPDYESHLLLTEPTHEELAQQRLDSRKWDDPPLLSIVTPVYRPPVDVFEQTVASVLAQTYEHWHWHIVDTSPDDVIWEYLSALAVDEPRLKLTRAENKGISHNTNLALGQAAGEFIVALDHDDVLASQALYLVARTIRENPEVDFIYSDHDKLNELGFRCNPWFRPDWSPEMMLSVNYVFHLGAYRRALLDKVGLFNPDLDVAQDWDLYLRMSEHTDAFHHIPRVLYHWRMSSTSTAQSLSNKGDVRLPQQAAIRQHLERLGLDSPEVLYDEDHPIYWIHPLVRWQQREPKRVSIIIPSRDNARLVERCLESIFALTTYQEFEVVLVDTGSTQKAALQLYERYSQNPAFRLAHFTGPFNFSAACNFGAGVATGDVLLFLNNDTEVLEPDWLQLMAQWFEVPGIGVVGAKLLYPDGTLQHAGVVVGMGGLAGHLFTSYDENAMTIFGSDAWYRNLHAVTGACLMIPRAVFDEVGQFDEGYRLIFNDVDLCLRVNQAGYRILYTPHVRLVHHEFGTREGSIPFDDFEKASSEHLAHFIWPDGYYNVNLSYAGSRVMLASGGRSLPSSLNADLRQRLAKREKDAVAPAESVQTPDLMPDAPGLNFVGDLQADIGLGDSSRALVEAASSCGVQVNYVELPYLLITRTAPLPNKVRQAGIYPVTVIHENPQGLAQALPRIPAPVLKNKYVVGVWYWELPVFPGEWHWTLDHVDEVWVASHYVRQIFELYTRRPVMRMPLTVSVPTTDAGRSHFGLPDDRFVFMYSFSTYSSVGRKNPFGVVEAFRQAFGAPRSGPLLVLKSHHLGSAPGLARPLAAAVERVGGVLMDAELTRQQMNDLLNVSDAYVSLHRAEGFGLGMAEAMALGKPVVATGYSGNSDFMTAENSYPVDFALREIVLEDHRYQPGYEHIYAPGQIWAEPDVEQAAGFMRAVYENQEEARQKGERARRDMAAQYSREAQAAFIEQRLTAILKGRAG